MATGVITNLKLNKADGVKYGFVSCSGRADCRFEEADLDNAEMTADLLGRSVEYDEMGDVAKHVRVAD